jgi:hypothetical protein
VSVPGAGAGAGVSVAGVSGVSAGSLPQPANRPRTIIIDSIKAISFFMMISPFLFVNIYPVSRSRSNENSAQGAIALKYITTFLERPAKKFQKRG